MTSPSSTGVLMPWPPGRRAKAGWLGAGSRGGGSRPLWGTVQPELPSFLNALFTRALAPPMTPPRRATPML